METSADERKKLETILENIKLEDERAEQEIRALRRSNKELKKTGDRLNRETRIMSRKLNKIKNLNTIVSKISNHDNEKDLKLTDDCQHKNLESHATKVINN